MVSDRLPYGRIPTKSGTMQEHRADPYDRAAKNAAQQRNLLSVQSAASNPKALLTAYSDYQKCLWGSARLKRLSEQPKNVDTFIQKSALHFCKTVTQYNFRFLCCILHYFTNRAIMLQKEMIKWLYLILMIYLLLLSLV